jgi:S1-C subfamily serine protease
MEAYDFVGYVRENYLAGDRVLIDVLRDGQRLQLPMTLRGQAH